MKRMCLWIISLFCLTASADLDSYSQITNLWFCGSRTNVLSIAEQRLSQNTNDVVGLVLKLEYDVSYCAVDSLSNSVLRLTSVAPNTAGSHFQTEYQSETNFFNFILRTLPTFPRETLLEESAKGDIPNKPMEFENLLEALWLDGFLAD